MNWGAVLPKEVVIQTITDAAPYFSGPIDIDRLAANAWPESPMHFTQWVQFCRDTLKPHFSTLAPYAAAALIQAALRDWPIPHSKTVVRAFKGLARHVAEGTDDSERMERELACATMNPGLTRDLHILHRRTGAEGLIITLEFRKPTSPQVVARWSPTGSNKELLETELFDLLPLSPGFAPDIALKVHPVRAEEILAELKAACPEPPTSEFLDNLPPRREHPLSP